MKIIFLTLLLLHHTNAHFLQINATSTTGLSYAQKPIFLSGANLAWIDYGQDFGLNQSQAKACALQEIIKNISDAGANSLRVWLFVEGQSVPQFDTTGMVTNTDASGTMLRDLKRFLAYAASKSIFVILTLWNGALMREQRMKDLITDTNKLQSFFDNALIPLVQGLKLEPALAAWEIMNEPEGSVDIHTVDSAQPCFDTNTVLRNSGAGWSKSNQKMEHLLRFFNLHAAAIKTADPTALVTVGAWSQYSSTDASITAGKTFFNYYKDECLIAGGGKTKGTLDFYQIHTYAGRGDKKYANGSPFGNGVVDVSTYKLDKPMVIGEFSSGSTGGQRSVQSLYAMGLKKKFAGVWDWSLLGGDGNDNKTSIRQGLLSLKGNELVDVDINNGGEIVKVNHQCSCSDIPPPGGYTCSQQASWGKCSSSFMKGYCCRSCFACVGCK